MRYNAYADEAIVTLHTDDCGHRPRIPVYPCGCTDTSPRGHHRSWCEAHVTTEAITAFLGTADWDEWPCRTCHPVGGSLRG